MNSLIILSQRFVLILLLVHFKLMAYGQKDIKTDFVQPQSKGLFSSNSEVNFSVTKLKDLCFGAFYPGKFGGSIEVNEDGIRSSNGSVILLNSELQPSPAVFEIRCPSNTLINVIVEETIVMKNSNNTTVVCEIVYNEKSNFISPANAENGFLYSVGGRITTTETLTTSTEDYTGTISITVVFE
ncbi:MAG: DUF4402 domain-containing protein [Fluviicola sp.]|jgi:hypothetical protein